MGKDTEKDAVEVTGSPGRDNVEIHHHVRNHSGVRGGKNASNSKSVPDQTNGPKPDSGIGILPISVVT